MSYDVTIDANTKSPTNSIDITQSPVFTKLVTNISVKPQQRKDVIIGSSDDTKGFSIELSPNTMPVDSVYTEITAIGSKQHFNYALHIKNSSHQTVNAEVWQM